MPGEKSAMFSVADSARFDVKTRIWESLPSLPEPRSSHDRVTIGNQLIVVGGWTLRGAQAPIWLNAMEVLNLSSPKREWKSVRQPLKRRALIAAAYSEKL